MNDFTRWKVTEKSDVHFCAEDPNGYWTVYQNGTAVLILRGLTIDPLMRLK